VLKSQEESFLLFLREGLVDVYARDDNLAKPRGVALINSAYYKILYMQEKKVARDNFGKSELA